MIWAKVNRRRRWKIVTVLTLLAVLLPPLMCHLKHLLKEQALPSGTDVFPSNSSKKHVFEGFNNESGYREYIVPNIIHYVRFDQPSFTFVEYICVQSAYLKQRPDAIYFHTNLKTFKGKYWRQMMNQTDFVNRIKLVSVSVPSEIFGQKLNQGWRRYHGSDVTRIRLLQKYGGIYLDNDVYVVNNLDKYRYFEMAIAWDEGQFLGNQVIVAHKNARFLPLWLETYRQYDGSRW